MLGIARQSIDHSWMEFPTHIRLFLKGQYIKGNKPEEFEKALKEYIQVRHSILMPSARIAFYLLLKAFNFEKGKEIIVPAYTFHIIPNIIQMVGLRPVFADCKKDSNNIDPKEIEKLISPNTVAIVPTHTLGNACDIQEITSIAKKHDLTIIEDCAHALGTKANGKKVGTFGDAAIFSFGMGKNIDCFGGGFLATNNDALAKKIVKKKQHMKYPSIATTIKNAFASYVSMALSRPFLFTILVYPILRIAKKMKKSPLEFMKEPEKLLKSLPENEFRKFTNIQAAIGLHLLQSYEQKKRDRQKKAEWIKKQIIAKQIQLPSLREGDLHLLYYARSPHRNYFRKRLFERRIDTKGAYLFVCPEMEMFKPYYRYCKNAKKTRNNEFNIPIDNYLNDKQVKYIIASINKIDNEIRG